MPLDQPRPENATRPRRPGLPVARRSRRRMLEGSEPRRSRVCRSSLRRAPTVSTAGCPRLSHVSAGVSCHLLRRATTEPVESPVSLHCVRRRLCPLLMTSPRTLDRMPGSRLRSLQEVATRRRLLGRPADYIVQVDTGRQRRSALRAQLARPATPMPQLGHLPRRRRRLRIAKRRGQLYLRQLAPRAEGSSLGRLPGHRTVATPRHVREPRANIRPPP